MRKSYEKKQNLTANESCQSGESDKGRQKSVEGTRRARAEGKEMSGLAKAKVTQVIEIIEYAVLPTPSVSYNADKFDIHDARWCIKLLAEAIVDLLPEESE